MRYYWVNSPPRLCFDQAVKGKVPGVAWRSVAARGRTLGVLRGPSRATMH